jgi:outer membrane protein assembly factor BamB
MFPQTLKKINQLMIQRLPRLVMMPALLLSVSVAMAATSWPQYQGQAQHTGKAGDTSTVHAPTSKPAINWYLKTGGSVRSSATVTLNATTVGDEQGVTVAYSDTTVPGMAAGSTTVQVNATATVHVGDPLMIENDYLGPVTAINTTTDPKTNIVTNTITVTYASTVPHADGVALTCALTRADTLSVAANAGDPAIKVNNPGRFMLGDLISINGVANGHVTAIVGYTLTLDTPVSAAYAIATSVTVGNPGKTSAYIGSDDGTLYALNPDSGLLYWKSTANAALGAVRGAPAVDANLARVYVASASGRIFAFAEQGEFLWAYPNVTAPAFGPIAGAPVLDAAGNIYLVANGQANANGTQTPATVYQITPDGTLGASFALNADETAGSLALYSNSAGNLRVVCGTTNRAVANTGHLPARWQRSGRIDAVAELCHRGAHRRTGGRRGWHRLCRRSRRYGLRLHGECGNPDLADGECRQSRGVARRGRVGGERRLFQRLHRALRARHGRRADRDIDGG